MTSDNPSFVTCHWSFVKRSMSIPTTTADSIEFHCTGCGRTLKVPASAAGKRASCPQCNTVVQVPAYQPEASGRSANQPESSARDFQQSSAPARDLTAPPSAAWALPPQPPAAPPPPQPQASPAGTPPSAFAQA